MIELDDKTVATVLECAQLFEYNVSKQEWMELWNEADPEKDNRLAEHMWGKFHRPILSDSAIWHTARGVPERTVEGIDADLLNTFGHSDLHVSRILSRMIIIRCKKQDPDVLTRYDVEETARRERLLKWATAPRAD